MMARLTLGLDIFECTCGELVVMSRNCPVCGRTNADVLAEKAGKKPPKKRDKKFCLPAKAGKFIDSFLFKKGKK